MNKVINGNPYIRQSRAFPEHDIHNLSVELDKAYIDIANAVNQRTIGLFPVTSSAITGEAWYLNKGQRQQTIRQVYLFNSAGNIVHGIDFNKIGGFTAIYGTFVDTSGVWYPLPYVDVVAADNQINVIVNSTEIIITGGGGGGQPVISSGYVILEWLTLA